MCRIVILASCFVCFFVATLARSTEPPTTETTTLKSAEEEEPVTIVTEENIVLADGNYRYSYISGDGSKAQQSGQLRTFKGDSKEDNKEEKAGEAVKGSFEYISPDGETISITYTADENGYRPSGSILPTPPPIPEAILQGLKFIKEHPWVEEKPVKKAPKSDKSETAKKSPKGQKTE